MTIKIKLDNDIHAWKLEFENNTMQASSEHVWSGQSLLQSGILAMTVDVGQVPDSNFTNFSNETGTVLCFPIPLGYAIIYQ